jgi:hypothetical protein
MMFGPCTALAGPAFRGSVSVVKRRGSASIALLLDWRDRCSIRQGKSTGDLDRHQNIWLVDDQQLEPVTILKALSRHFDGQVEFQKRQDP